MAGDETGSAVDKIMGACCCGCESSRVRRFDCECKCHRLAAQATGRTGIIPDKVGELVKHGCGATSTQLDGQWDDVPFEGVAAAARRFAYGRKMHGKGNWKQGDEAFAEERLNHMLRHAFLLSEHRRWEDLEAVLCNAMMLAWYAAKGILKLSR